MLVIELILAHLGLQTAPTRSLAPRRALLAARAQSTVVDRAAAWHHGTWDRLGSELSGPR
jgi:hypothetical protein